jgi:hypothetical protein
MSFVRNPALRCPFCDSEILTCFRTKMSVAFDAADASEKETLGSVTAFHCGEDPTKCAGLPLR